MTRNSDTARQRYLERIAAQATAPEPPKQLPETLEATQPVRLFQPEPESPASPHPVEESPLPAADSLPPATEIPQPEPAPESPVVDLLETSDLPEPAFQPFPIDVAPEKNPESDEAPGDIESGLGLPAEESFVPFPDRQQPESLPPQAPPENQPAPAVSAAAPAPVAAPQPPQATQHAQQPFRVSKLWFGLLLAGLAAILSLVCICIVGTFVYRSGFAAQVTAIFTPTPQRAIAFASGKGRATTVATDVTGKARLTDPVTQQPVEITVQAAENQQPLPNIDVHYMSDGTQVLVIATDPSGQRAPAVVQPPPQQDPSQPQTIVIDMQLLSSFNSAQEIMDYYRSRYPLQAWNWATEDYCQTPQELTEKLAPEKASGMLFIPLLTNSDAVTSLVSDPQQGPGLLQLFEGMLQPTAQAPAGLSTVLHLRYYRLAPLPLTLVEWQGVCRTSNSGQIAYIGLDYNVYIYQPDSNQTIQVTQDGSENLYYHSPVFSPDGKSLAFFLSNKTDQYDNEKSSLYVVNASTLSTRLLINDGGMGLSWAPDSERIAYGRMINSNCILSENGIQHVPAGIWLANNSTAQTSELFHIEQPGDFQEGVGSPGWSPNGTEILFITYPCFSEGYGYAIWDRTRGVVRLNQIEHAPKFISWMPNSSSFLGADPPPMGFYPSGIYEYNLDGQVIRTVYFDQTQEVSDLIVSPDGQSVVFGSARADEVNPSVTSETSLNMISIDGSGLHNIAGSASYPAAWSPDSTQILFYSGVNYGDNGTAELSIYHISQGTTTKIADTRINLGADWGRLP
jgi:Tol biopolymer transport system component